MRGGESIEGRGRKERKERRGGAFKALNPVGQKRRRWNPKPSCLPFFGCSARTRWRDGGDGNDGVFYGK